MNILQKIFTDHYEEIKYTLHPRDTEMENIEKMIHCGDPSFGGAMYHCPHCGNFKYVPFHCHSRFCPSCGNKYSMERTTSMTFKLINVKHLVMIPWNVPSAGIKWSFWNFILTISVFPSKNYMRDLCPDLAESVLLHNFLCFYGIIPS